MSLRHIQKFKPREAICTRCGAKYTKKGWCETLCEECYYKAKANSSKNRKVSEIFKLYCRGCNKQIMRYDPRIEISFHKRDTHYIERKICSLCLDCFDKIFKGAGINYEKPKI